MNVTVGANEVSSGRLMLEPGVVATIAFEQNIGAVEIISDGSAAAFYTCDGSEPTIDGTNTFELPAGVQSVDVRDTTNLPGSPTDVIKILSSGSPVIRVQIA